MTVFDKQDGDDRRFLALVSRIIDSVPRDIQVLFVIRVDNWFDHKWLRFSGNGRVPFSHFKDNHPGVALDAFWQDKLTFPPFSPKRILSQWRQVREGATWTKCWAHPQVFGHSSANLQRRVTDVSDSLAAIWFSSRTEDNGRGCIMEYDSRGGEPEAWYASFRLSGPSWHLDRVKGTDRERVAALLRDDEPAPRSGPQCTVDSGTGGAD